MYPAEQSWFKSHVQNSVNKMFTRVTLLVDWLTLKFKEFKYGCIFDWLTCMKFENSVMLKYALIM